MTKPCIFCNKTDSPPSREHAIPTWISREFPGSVWEVTALGTSTQYRSRGNLGVVTRKVCERCNGGWMRDLEEAVRPLIVPMFHRSEVTLSPDGQMTLAHWLTKTAMTYDLASAQWREPFFGESERHALLPSSSLSISLETTMHLACYDGPIYRAGHNAKQTVKSRLGVERNYNIIARYERGRSVPYIEVVLAYARAVGVEMNEIVDDDLDLNL